MEPGERWTQAKYDEMNAGKDEPFFWPLIPLYNVRTTTGRFTTPNGGTFVESMKPGFPCWHRAAGSVGGTVAPSGAANGLL